MKAGFIGLGAMGQGMARNLAKAGYLEGVYNRTPDKLPTEFRTFAYPTVQALSAAVDAVFICISADNDVLEVVNKIAGSVRPGSIIVDMSTVSSTTAREAAALLRPKRADFLDAPVSGGVEGANKGTLVMMVGGKTEILEKVRPLLSAMTAHIEHMGGIGSGQACKAVNQILAAGINQAVTEALAFAETQGLDMDKVIDIVSGGAAGNWFLSHRGKTMVRGIFKPGFKLALHHKDLQICKTMAEQAGYACPLTEATLLDYQRLMADGLGDEDISALYRLKRKQ